MEQVGIRAAMTFDEIYAEAETAEEKKAAVIYQEILEDPDVLTEGRRNNDAVDICVCLGILALPLANALAKLDDEEKADELAERAETIIPYVKDWMSYGDDNALSKMFR